MSQQNTTNDATVARQTKTLHILGVLLHNANLMNESIHKKEVQEDLMKNFLMFGVNQYCPIEVYTAIMHAESAVFQSEKGDMLTADESVLLSTYFQLSTKFKSFRMRDSIVLYVDKIIEENIENKGIWSKSVNKDILVLLNETTLLNEYYEADYFIDLLNAVFNGSSMTIKEHETHIAAHNEYLAHIATSAKAEAEFEKPSAVTPTFIEQLYEQSAKKLSQLLPKGSRMTFVIVAESETDKVVGTTSYLTINNKVDKIDLNYFNHLSAAELDQYLREDVVKIFPDESHLYFTTIYV